MYLCQITVLLQQNTTASLLELYFNDSMQTVYARGGGGRPNAYFSHLFKRNDVISHDQYNLYHVTFTYSLGGASHRVLA